jgi:ubiquinone/menaquinone biosynthesis C-methylase UbiE
MSDVSRIYEVRRSASSTPDGFQVRYDTVSKQIIDFVGGAGISYAGKAVLDIGSGDGVIDLGVAAHAGAHVTGIDINGTRVDDVIYAANLNGADTGALDRLAFIENTSTGLSFPDASFDHAFSWSVFEHVFSPVALLKDVHRILKPGGTLFMQIWPMWRSEWGAHLFENVRPWQHLVETREGLLNGLPNRVDLHDISYDSCNHLTLGDIQRALLAANFSVAKLELEAGVVAIPDEMQHLPWTDLAISGFKLIARRN